VCSGSQQFHKDEWDTIFHQYFPQTDTVDPNAPPANPAAPAEKKKAWNLNWGSLSEVGRLTCLLNDLSLAPVWTCA